MYSHVYAAKQRNGKFVKGLHVSYKYSRICVLYRLKRDCAYLMRVYILNVRNKKGVKEEHPRKKSNRDKRRDRQKKRARNRNRKRKIERAKEKKQK